MRLLSTAAHCCAHQTCYPPAYRFGTGRQIYDAAPRRCFYRWTQIGPQIANLRFHHRSSAKPSGHREIAPWNSRLPRLLTRAASCAGYPSLHQSFH